MKHIYRILIFGLIALASLSATAQTETLLSQYMLHQPFINPAAIGASKYMNGALLYRKQWAGFQGAPSVGGVNFNAPFKKKKNFLGLTVFNDQIGVNTRTDISASYAYRVGLSEKSSLAFGLSASLAMLQSRLGDVNTTQAQIDGTIDPVFSSNTQTFAAPDFKFGVYFFTKRFYAGFSIPSLLDNQIVFGTDYSNNIGFDINTWHYFLHSGYRFRLSEKLDLGTSVLMKLVSGAPIQFDVNMQAIYNNLFGIGMSYRSQQVLVAMANVQITKYFKLGYAYDYNFAALKQVSTGSHEIMLIFNLVKTTQPVKIDAPRF